MINSVESPGKVELDEILIRIIVAPDHIDEHKKIVYSAISSQDLTERGCSVNRKKYANKKILENTTTTLLSKNKERSVFGFGLISCELVESVTDDIGHKALYVKEHPLGQDVSHAHIYSTKKYTSSVCKKIRKQLIENFNPVLKSIDEIFNL